MEQIASLLDDVLYMERKPPPLGLSTAQGCQRIERAFWDDAFGRNLALDNVEIEFRCGRRRQRHFDSQVSASVFGRIVDSMQAYTAWDDAQRERSVVSYFDTVDGSVRKIDSERGTQIMSKQRVLIADFTVDGCAFDIRMAVSIEVEIADRPPLQKATRRIVRDRASYTLNPWRYDLTKATDEDGNVAYHVEIELVDPVQVQTENNNSQCIAALLQRRFSDMMRVLEPDSTEFRPQLVHKRWY